MDADAHHALARSAAAECAVLLKNQDHLLPLRPAAGDTIAVVGEFARTPRYQGAGSSQVNPARVDVPLDELRSAVPDGVEVAFAAGYGLDPSNHDQELAAEAVALARRAEVVVAFLGLAAADESEGFDRTHLDLPANQTALLARLADANPNLAVVLANGSAVRLSDWDHHAKRVSPTGRPGRHGHLQEWLADPTGSVLLHKAVGTDDQGRPKGILGNTELLPVIGNFPISTLAAFPGLGFTHDLIHALTDQISASDR